MEPTVTLARRFWAAIEPIHAIVYFAPGMVTRAIPDAWRFATPEAVLDARLTSAPEALRHHAGAALPASAGELADLLWEGAAGCRFDGRPLAAAWAGVPRPADPVGAVWLATTALREHRGDGHVLAGVAHGLRGLDATVTFAATGAITRAMVQPTRGWTDEDWTQSSRRLRAIELAAPVSRHLMDTGVVPVPNPTGAPRP